ncbi:MAG: NACHT domain-containing protein, partial [Cyanobacteria bacterium P01_A01_bin.114]
MSENQPAPESAQLLEDPKETRRRKRQKRTQMILRVLGIPGGLGVAATVQQLQAGQIGLALLTGLASIGGGVLAIFAKFFSELFNKVLDLIEERLEETTDSLAEWIVAQLESALVRFWWQVTPQFRGAYYKSLIYHYRTYRTQGLKTPGEFSPDLAKVFVPLRITAKSLEQISPALIQRQEATGNLEIWDFLAESKREPAYQRIVIIGAPGSGKTTLLRHITLTYAYNTHQHRSRKMPTLVPVLLPLHKIRDDITVEQPKALPALIVAQVKTLPRGKTLNLSPQWFESKLLNGKCLVMLDGLDEVADETQRQQVSRWVDEQMRAYPDALWILTSRPYGYRNAQLTEARTTLGVQAFNLRQMELFLRRWYLQNEILRQARQRDPGVEAAAENKADDLIGQIKNYPPLAAMALNPLLLTMIATVHDNRGALPGSRVDLYDEICDVLLVRRQEAKGLTEPFPLKAEQKKSVLQVLALELMVHEAREFSAAQGAAMVQAPLRAVAGDGLTPKDFLEHIETVSGLLLEREVGLYQFAHLSFQEYLASVQIKETGRNDQPSSAELATVPAPRIIRPPLHGRHRK